MERNIYLYLEFSGGVLSTASTELLGLADRLFSSASLTALAGRAQPAQAMVLPVAQVYLGGVDYPVFPDLLARAAAELPLPDLLLAPMSADGRAFAAAYAALTRLPLAHNVVEIAAGQSQLRVKRAAANDQALASTELSYPYVLLLRPGVWGTNPPLEQEDIPRINVLPLPEAFAAAQVERVYTASRQEMELNEASIVVSGGAGMQTADHFRQLGEVGALLNAPLGGSRIALDQGWIEHRQMIGATGQTIAPQLYLCFGVSGAMQHSVGIRGSERVIAVNHDPTAAIFGEADLAVEGDAMAIREALGALLMAYQPREGKVAP